SVQEYEDEAGLLAALQAGEASYGILVPTGFTDRVTAGEAAEWHLYPGKDATHNVVAGRVARAVLDQINFRQAAAIAMADMPAAAGFGPVPDMALPEIGPLTDSVDLHIVS